MNDQEVQRRRVRGLLPPWSSDGWKNVELMLLLICGMEECFDELERNTASF